MKEEAKLVPATVAADQSGLISVIERAAMSPDVDIEKMERLLAMQERILDRQAAELYAVDMRAAQQEMPKILARDVNPQTNSQYAKLDKVIDAITPVYTKHGFSLSFSEGHSPAADVVRVRCTIMHTSGHSKEVHADMPVVTTGIKGSVNKTVTHARGEAFTYGRRYLTAMIFNLSIGISDNDGNAPSSEFITEEQVKQIEEFFENDGDPEWKQSVLAWLAENVAPSLEEVPKKRFAHVLRAVKKAFEKREEARVKAEEAS